MDLNPVALLALISNLVEQNAALVQENQQLREELAATLPVDE